MKTKLTLTLLVAFVAILNVRAASDEYYVELKTHVAESSSGLGLVYAEAEEDKVEVQYSESSAKKLTSNESGSKHVFKAYAQVKNEETTHFTGWSLEEGGMPISSDNPYSIEIACPNTAYDCNTITLYANFAEIKDYIVTLIEPENGTFSVTDNTVTVTNSGSLSTRETLSMKAEAAEGYKFLGWYVMKDEKKVYFTDNETASMVPTGDVQIGADFVKNDVALFGIVGKGISYASIQEANAAASSGDIIYLKSEGILAEGDHIVPEGVTLLIPFDSQNTCYKNDVVAVNSYSTPNPYRTLKMAKGAKLIVEGELSVSSTMHASKSNTTPPGGATTGDCGMIEMEEGSSIELNSGAKMYVWGYVIGDGQVIANSGATVYEPLMLTDFRGGSAMMSFQSLGGTVYPVNQYYVQNVEVPLTICYGAKEMVISALNISEAVYQMGDITFVGDNGFFVLEENSTITKHYDGRVDRQIYDVEGDAALGNIVLKFSGAVASSKNYVLPITNNMTINIKRGEFDLLNNVGVALLPDAKIVVGEDATLAIGDGNLYVYDSDQWGNYALNQMFRPVQYSPTKTFTRTTLSDATIDVRGKVVSKGKGSICTTLSGANICCTEGSGTIEITNKVADDAVTSQILQKKEGVSLVDIPVTTAKLKNEDETYVETQNVESGTTFYYVNGKWIDQLLPVFAFDAENHKLTLVNKCVVPIESLIQNLDDEVANNNTILSLDLSLAESVKDGEEDVLPSKVLNVLIDKMGTRNALLIMSSNEEGCPNVIVRNEDGSFEAEELNVVDKQAIDVPVSFNAKNISYTRKNTNYKDYERQFGTICLPFVLQSDEKVQYYLLSGLEDGCVVLCPVDYVDANVPVVYSVPTGEEELIVKMENTMVEPAIVTSAGDGLYLVGVQSVPELLLPQSNNYFISKNHFWNVTSTSVTVHPQRAYIASANEIRIKSFAVSTLVDEANSIASLYRDEKSCSTVHNINGTRLSRPLQGLNIVRYADGKVVKYFKR